MDSTSSDEDLIVVTHPKKKKRRFWAHPLLQSRDRERVSPPHKRAETVSGLVQNVFQHVAGKVQEVDR